MSYLLRHVREAAKNVCSINVFSCISQCPWLNHIHYVYIKSRFTVYSSFFKIRFQVIFVHYILHSPLIVGLRSHMCFLAVLDFILSVHNRSPSVIVCQQGLIPVFLLQSLKVLIVQYNPYYISYFHSSQIVRFVLNGISIVIIDSVFFQIN